MPLTLKNFYVNTPGWDMDNRTLSQTSSSLGSGFYTGVYVKEDGTKIFFSDASAQRIYECTLTTPFDISSLSLSKYIASAYPEDLTFSPDGTKMFVLKSDASPYQVIRYTLSTARDISTATQDQAITAGTANGDRGIYIVPDGLNIYRSMAGQNTLHKAIMSTAWDLSTASSWDSTSNYGGVAIWFGDNGKFFARRPDGGTNLNWYKLSTPYDLSTISTSGTKMVGSDYCLGLWFNNAGTMAFAANGNNNTITKYTIKPGWKPNANTVAWYKLEGDANDYSGNGNNATWSGASSYTTVLGNVSANFTGSAYINTGVSIGSGPLTIACMYYHSNGSGYQTVFGTPLAWNGAPDVGLCFFNNNYYFWTGSSSASEVGQSTGDWHFCAIRIDGSGNVKMNMDTSQSTTTTSSFTISDTVYIGAGLGNRFKGNVKQLAIWNTSISDDELEEYRKTTMGLL